MLIKRIRRFMRIAPRLRVIADVCPSDTKLLSQKRMIGKGNLQQQKKLAQSFTITLNYSHP